MEATNRLQRSRLALVTLGHFLNDSYGSFFAPLLPLLLEKLSLSLTAASGLAAFRRSPLPSSNHSTAWLRTVSMAVCSFSWGRS